MNLIQAIESCFNNYVTFTGRAPRSEYNYWFLFIILVSIAVNIIAPPDIYEGETMSALGILVSLILAPPGISVLIRRFHDINKSGWNYFWVLTIIGMFPVLYWLILKAGDSDENHYGHNPLQGINVKSKQSYTASSDDEPVPVSKSQPKPKAKSSRGSYKKGGLYDE